ncbi:xanthine phosphoribosyltransferase [Liquorilactobacillus mali]|uniref:Xanthine phosphoribosyltransferase n=1 Tax=Liquorilactobacillus mali KCTC 3596 = DSM 20444 TaxID=1046596 RepID=J1F421_9LACO|nr:xanthine phosphoribosyltransferase [Liquorilactobacillus mali]EJF00546.1 xanthine phosphoribosyltransferase [Liquorilactobacillus mali KCTC 3596 = DSM 20444]KRN09701.1 xanthine phosphoribosyltransferase [Liquorilactobacillus mali KCTC 3596 = DSM 20444]MDV7758367.1 xanthine phosphoribosyltransferase [Liquorilactobacillus mali]QFQ73992.1 xanthine phosphoribosyltransferase [Liquorilactobacillus mali]
MKLLEDRIREDGLVLPDNVLKVNQFLNHQIDPDLMYKLGEEFVRLYQGEKITKIVTIEASGIAPAIMTGLILHVPVLFARKQKSSTMNSKLYTAEVYSYTKKVKNTVSVDQKFLSKDDHVLIIDDFLANGQAVQGLIDICNEAQAELVGVGIAIEKSFQDGAKLIKEQGVRLESLARISSFAGNQVHFVGDENNE